MMPWAKLDDGYFTNPKVVELSAEAKCLDLAGITYCARELTDGIVSERATHIIAAHAGVDLAPSLFELLTVGRWHRNGTGYEIHDYVRYNPDRATVLARRGAVLARVAKHRRDQVDGGDVDDFADSNGVCNGVCNGVTDSGVTAYRATRDPGPLPVLKDSTHTSKSCPAPAPKNGPPPTRNEVLTYLAEKGHGRTKGEAFLRYVSDQNWCCNNGRPITNWKQAAELFCNDNTKQPNNLST